MKPNSVSKPSPVPLVSVTITTFNHEEWLPRALESVLEQQRNFPIEIIISDDCSRDKTLNIAHSYLDRHPGLIRVLEHSKNVGVQRNTYDILEQCSGRYIAVLDGDDYWTNPNKISMQVSVLESDPSINVCGHIARWVTTTGEVTRERYPSMAPGRYGLIEILRHNFLATPSIMFRHGVHRRLPSWYFDFESLSDWPLWVLSAMSGDIVLLADVMADVRQSSGSSFMGKGPFFWNRMDAEFYEQIENLVPSAFRRIVRAEKGKRYETMSYLLRKQGDFPESRKFAVNAFCAPSLMDNCKSKTKTLLAASLRELEWRFHGGKAFLKNS